MTQATRVPGSRARHKRHSRRGRTCHNTQAPAPPWGHQPPPLRREGRGRGPGQTGAEPPGVTGIMTIRMT